MGRERLIVILLLLLLLCLLLLLLLDELLTLHALHLPHRCTYLKLLTAQ